MKTTMLMLALVLGACVDDEEPLFPGEAEVLTDGQVVGAAAAANQGEITVANAYLARGQNPAARDFAVQMQTEHAATLARQDALARSLGLSPDPSEIQAYLRTFAEQTAAFVTAAEPVRVDRLYADSQVEMHEQVLQILDRQLLPSATIPALRDELVRMRADVAAHLEEARVLQQSTVNP
jgi:putative membrane protein